MKILLSVIVIAGILSACKHPNDAIKLVALNADSAAINFFKGDGKMDTVVAVKIIRDKGQLNQLVGYISAATIKDNNPCGVDGSVHFFKQDKVVADVFFNTATSDCQRFTFMVNGERVKTELDAAAATLLNSFKK